MIFQNLLILFINYDKILYKRFRKNITISKKIQRKAFVSDFRNTEILGQKHGR